MPSALQPLMRHHCHALGLDQVQEGVRARAKAAGQRNTWGFDRVGEAGLEHADDICGMVFCSMNSYPDNDQNFTFVSTCTTTMQRTKT